MHKSLLFLIVFWGALIVVDSAVLTLATRSSPRIRNSAPFRVSFEIDPELDCSLLESPRRLKYSPELFRYLSGRVMEKLKILEFINSLECDLPASLNLAQLGRIYFYWRELDIFKAFCLRFPSCSQDKNLSLRLFEELLELIKVIRDDVAYFEALVINKAEVICRNLNQFWRLLLDADCQCEESHQTLHPCVAIAICSLYKALPESQNTWSFCIFKIILTANVTKPYSEAFLANLFAIPDLNLNAFAACNCMPVSMLVIGSPQLPRHYHRLFLLNLQLDINAIIPRHNRNYGSTTFNLPELPLFWHAFIYRNFMDLGYILSRRDLNLSRIISSLPLVIRILLVFFWSRFFNRAGASCIRIRSSYS